MLQRVSFICIAWIGLISCGPAPSLSLSPLPEPVPPSPSPGPELPYPKEGGFEYVTVSTTRALVSDDVAEWDVYLIQVDDGTKRLLRPVIPGSVMHWATDPEFQNDYVVFNYSSVGAGDSWQSDIWRYRISTNQYLRVSSVDNQASQLQFGLAAHEGSISADGTRVVFSSSASNLIAGQTLDGQNIFLKDLGAATLTRLSRPTDNSNLVNVNRPDKIFSWRPRISSDGRLMAFSSNATNLLAGVSDGEWDVYFRDLSSSALEKISFRGTNADARAHAFSPDLSDDGRYVVFQTLSNHSQLFDFETLNAPAPRCPGVPRGATSTTDFICGANQIILRDRSLQRNETISVSPEGDSATCGWTGQARISREGRYVAFSSSASNLSLGQPNSSLCSESYPKRIYVRDRILSVTRSFLPAGMSNCDNPKISEDALEILFICHQNAAEHLFVGRMSSGQTKQIY